MIEKEVWKPDPDKPGCLTLDRRKTRGEILYELNVHLAELSGEPKNLSLWKWREDASSIHWSEPFPEYKWLACFAVVGSSEGHWVHIETIDKDGKREPIYLCETFAGPRAALEIANAAAIALGAV